VLEDLQIKSAPPRDEQNEAAGGRMPMTAWRDTVVVLSLGVLAASSSSAAQGVSSEAQELARLSLSSGQFDRIGTQAGKIGVLPVQKAIESGLDEN
jgi:hypothetical protein